MTTAGQMTLVMLRGGAMTEVNEGKLAYEAYARDTGWKSLVSGDRLPAWEDLPFPIQHAWQAAADAIIMGVDI